MNSFSWINDLPTSAPFPLRFPDPYPLPHQIPKHEDVTRPEAPLDKDHDKQQHTKQG